MGRLKPYDGDVKTDNLQIKYMYENGKKGFIDSKRILTIKSALNWCLECT